MINSLLVGAFSMASGLVSLFFFRFWKNTGDRFFLLFALSFALEALSRFIVEFAHLHDQKPHIYLIRLIAYILILWAIYDKNRSSDSENNSFINSAKLPKLQ